LRTYSVIGFFTLPITRPSVTFTGTGGVSS
jgi:hypothetical protein